MSFLYTSLDENSYLFVNLIKNVCCNMWLCLLMHFEMCFFVFYLKECCDV
jgi:hypothetical protein